MSRTLQLAQDLERARAERQRLGPLPDPALRPGSLAEGYAVAHARAQARGAVPPAGFKIGGTAEVMRRYLGLAEPLGGFIETRDLHPSGRVLPRAGFIRPGVECEIAARLGRDLPSRTAPYLPAEVAGAVAAWLPAIELVDDRYAVPVAELGAPLLVADQVFHAAGILGPPSRGPFDLETVEGVLRIDGVVRGRGRGADLLGGPANALAWLASSACAESFGGLRAGQVVLCGSVCTPVWLAAEDTVIEADFGAFGRAVLRFA